MQTAKIPKPCKLPLLSGVALSTSMVVGSGLFSLTGIALSQSGAGGSVLAWLLSAASVLPFLFIFAKMSKNGTTGLTGYVREAFGDAVGCGISLLLIATFIINVPISAYLAALYLSRIFHLGSSSVFPVSVAIIAIGTFINLVGSCWVTKVNRGSVLLLFGLLTVLFIGYYEHATRGMAEAVRVGSTLSIPELKSLWATAAMLFFAFIGWESASFGLGPQRSIAKVFAWSFLLVTLIYFFFASIVAGTSLADFEVGGASGILALIGNLPFGRYLVMATAITLIANVLSWIYGASRVAVSAGRLGAISARFGEMDGRGLPANALLHLCALYVGVLWLQRINFLDLNNLIALVNQSVLVVYVLILASYLKLHRVRSRWIVGGLCSISLSFLFSGFMAEFCLFPLMLLFLGYLRFRWTHEAVARTPGQIAAA